MEIDLEKAKQEFIEYTNKYDINNENISRKIGHSIRVMNISKRIAIKIGLTQDEIKIAEIIGLLHDIARFEQFTQFETFNDLNSFDHGNYALEILDKDIRKYIQNDKYDEIIKIAIKNHNKFEIEEGLKEKELVFAKLIRDADKIDIIYEAVEMFWKGIENQINNTKISERVEKQFKSYKQIKRGKDDEKIPNIDEVIGVIAFIFDVNYRESFEIIKKEDYINKILNRFDLKDQKSKEKIEEVRNIANIYINEKSKGMK
ncbi:MAG: HD domain-containing protein [Clostridia bacterium]|jgi:HD superfamily phosphohydrolase YqeK|nr:HD domain-containing protein [Clostridia bacterium]